MMARISQLQLVNFKNYSQETFVFHPHINAMVGLNGMGKTNVLDAIHTVALTKSHFMSRDKGLVKSGADFFRLQATFQSDAESYKVVVKYRQGGKKVIEWDETPLERLIDHIGRISLVFFAPDDEILVYGGSADRRKLLDSTLSQWNGQYLKQLVRYNKLLQYRNQLFHKSAQRPDPTLLDAIDEQLIPLGEMISEQRSRFLTEWAPRIRQNYSMIARDQEEVQILLKRSFASGELRQLMSASREKDWLTKRTHVGAHRDDVQFSIRDRAFKNYGSQGQVKSLLLAIRFAQFEYLVEEKSKEPLLMIDDIFDKLDEQRMDQVIQFLAKNANGQTFISYPNQERLELFLQKTNVSYKIFHIADGSIINEKTQ